LMALKLITFTLPLIIYIIYIIIFFQRVGVLYVNRIEAFFFFIINKK